MKEAKNMKLLIVSKNSTYKQLFEKREEGLTAFLTSSLSNTEKNIDAIFLVGEMIQIDDLNHIRELYPNQTIFFKPVALKSDILTKRISKVAAAVKIHVMNEYSTEEQLVDEITARLFEKDNTSTKRIISFFGTHSGAGVTTTVLNLARSLSQKTDEKVLVLSLNSWDPADYLYHYEGQYLNDLKVDLNLKNLTVQRLSEAIHYNDSFYHLAGNRDIKLQRMYQPYEIEHLIQVAQQIFDVILIDAGTHFDTAPTVQSYLSSGLKFLVTNQEVKGYRGYFPYVFHQLIEPAGGSADDFLLIINKYQPGNTLINEKDLEDELNMVKISTIPDVKELGTMAAYQRKLLYDFTESAYSKEIDFLSKLIISEGNISESINPIGKTKEKRGLFSLFN